MLEHTFPASFFDAAARNEVLQVVFFAMLFAIALAQVKPGPSKDILLGFFEGLADVMFKFTGLVMLFAPIGIGAAVAVTVGHSGIGVLRNLVILVLTLYGALIAFILLVLLPVALLARIPLRRFWDWVKQPWLIAFSTASLRGRTAARLREHGEVRRAAAHRRLRAAHGLLVQPRRLHALPRAWRRCSWPRRRASK